MIKQTRKSLPSFCYEGITSHNMEILKHCIDQGIDPNGELKGRKGGYLGLCASQFFVDGVRFLFEKGADVNSVGAVSGLRQMLHKLIDRNNINIRQNREAALEILKIYLNNGADLLSENYMYSSYSMGYTTIAIESDSPDIMMYLLSYYENKSKNEIIDAVRRHYLAYLKQEKNKNNEAKIQEHIISEGYKELYSSCANRMNLQYLCVRFFAKDCFEALLNINVNPLNRNVKMSAYGYALYKIAEIMNSYTNFSFSISANTNNIDTLESIIKKSNEWFDENQRIIAKKEVFNLIRAKSNFMNIQYKYHVLQAIMKYDWIQNISADLIKYFNQCTTTETGEDLRRFETYREKCIELLSNCNIIVASETSSNQDIFEYEV